jgi:aspartate aminotransferase
MLPDQSPSRVKKAYEAMAPVYEFIGKYQAWTAAKSDDDCNFALGNPHEMPLPGFVAALEKALTPQDKDWFAYKINEPSAVDPVATALSQQFNRPYDPADIFMTNGATGGLDVVLNTVVGRDDEVIFISPP